MNHIAKFCGILPLLTVLPLLTGCTREIPPAHAGIVFNANSGISQRLQKPQVVWLGWGDQLYTYPVNIHNATFVRSAREGESVKDDSVKCSTVEGAILPVDVTVAYHIPNEGVYTAFTSFGTEDVDEVQHTFIKPITIDGMNAVSGTHSIFELLSTDRSRFGTEVKAYIAPILQQWGIAVDDVMIGEMWTPDDVKARVQERVSARNELEMAKVRLQKARIDAGTILTKAKQDAETNQLLAKQGRTAVDLKRLEMKRKAVEKWDGVSPEIGDSTIPFTDISLR